MEIPKARRGELWYWQGGGLDDQEILFQPYDSIMILE